MLSYPSAPHYLVPYGLAASLFTLKTFSSLVSEWLAAIFSVWLTVPIGVQLQTSPKVVIGTAGAND